MSLCLIVTLNYTVKYFKMKNVFNNTLRYGYYEHPMVYGKKNDPDRIEFTPIIHVRELEKYTNGKSKVSMYKIEYMISDKKIEHDKVRNYIIDNFTEIMETDEITWLEIEKSLKDMRKEKMQKIIKSKFF